MGGTALDAVPEWTEARTMAEWISVKDRLPERNQRVFVYRPEMDGADTGPMSVQWGWSCACKRTDITHWMPLPEPPEEDTA